MLQEWERAAAGDEDAMSAIKCILEKYILSRSNVSKNWFSLCFRTSTAKF